MYLLDSDFLIASRFTQESTHPSSMSIADKVYNSQFVAVTEVVLMEVATVISHKYSQREAVETIAVLKGAGYTILSEDNAVLIKYLGFV